ncbi:MAG TPA: biopolymer transporter TolR [Panacibacter sp.]|nr:biopolymer transporter TolR [Panacibacter sp.]
MKKIIIILFVVCIPVMRVLAQKFPFGIFDAQTEVGNAKKGSCNYNMQTQEYIITGSGTNIWATHDEFQFLYKKMSGDFILTTNAAFIGKGVEEHRKWGWMVRQSLDTLSPHVNAVVHGDGLTSFQFRRTVGGITQEQKSSLTHADVVRLERKGNRYYMSVAHAGELFVMDSVDLDLGDNVYVGLFVCSHNNAVSETAVFRNVRITIPAPAALVPYKQYLGSQLEIMDVASATSNIIFQSPRSLQAPNYMPGGNHLIYNSEGLIYKFDLKTLTPSVLNTGSIKGNNNDHVISFNGKMLGISSSSKEDNASKVYTLPLSGGEPKQITPTGPSYLHGWSTDGKHLMFVGLRNGDYDIYKVPSAGGDEVNLTNSKGLDDGCEYSPDGKYIYFNSVRSGTMQIYRMKPDGSNVEQLTNDALNNWFAHPSPDGKWIVFISFGQDVSPSDHPFYKHVYIRLMPANGGTPRVIAYLYGGQGTMNTPCWSPDSKKIAFISNSNLLSEVYPVEKK